MRKHESTKYSSITISLTNTTTHHLLVLGLEFGLHGLFIEKLWSMNCRLLQPIIYSICRYSARVAVYLKVALKIPIALLAVCEDACTDDCASNLALWAASMAAEDADGLIGLSANRSASHSANHSANCKSPHNVRLG